MQFVVQIGAGEEDEEENEEEENLRRHREKRVVKLSVFDCPDTLRTGRNGLRGKLFEMDFCNILDALLKVKARKRHQHHCGLKAAWAKEIQIMH